MAGSAGDGELLRVRLPGTEGLWEIALEGDLISALRPADPAFADERTRWLTPGLFDLQVNGTAGVSFTDPPAALEHLAEADARLRAAGTSRYLATLISRDEAGTRAALVRLREAAERGLLSAAAGIHLEGPWISSEEGWRGVHQARFARDPDPQEFERLQEASGGRIRLVTIAPERPGSVEFIRCAVARGVVVAMGHSNASDDDVRRAADAGLTLSTHLFNGCARLIDRHRNPLYAQLAEDRLRACFIADGHHVPPAALRVGLRAKGWERSILVSDLAPPSGRGDGVFEMEGNSVEARDGGIFVRGSWLLSGAARTLAEDAAILGREPWPGIERALLMASRHPAEALGEPQWARLAAGRRGPLAVFRWDGRELALERRIGF